MKEDKAFYNSKQFNEKLFTNQEYKGYQAIKQISTPKTPITKEQSRVFSASAQSRKLLHNKFLADFKQHNLPTAVTFPLFYEVVEHYRLLRSVEYLS